MTALGRDWKESWPPDIASMFMTPPANGWMWSQTCNCLTMLKKERNTQERATLQDRPGGIYNPTGTTTLPSHNLNLTCHLLLCSYLGPKQAGWTLWSLRWSRTSQQERGCVNQPLCPESGLQFDHMAVRQLPGQPECVLVCVIVADCGLCVYLWVYVPVVEYEYEFVWHTHTQITSIHCIEREWV